MVTLYESSRVKGGLRIYVVYVYIGFLVIIKIFLETPEPILAFYKSYRTQGGFRLYVIYIYYGKLLLEVEI